MFKRITKFLILFLVVLTQFIFAQMSEVNAATSPTLNALNDYSVLGGQAVTCLGATTTTGAVGVSSGTSITGFPTPCTAGGGTQNNNASAIAAQAENLATFAALDQTCDQSFGAVDLTTTFPSGVGPGVYCSTSSFSLSGNLTLTGSGVHIFKTVSTLITSPGSSVTGGDACNVWWRVGSSATLDTTTSFKGNILALEGVNAMNTGATLNGRFLAQDAGTVTLNGNTITAPICTSSSSGSSSSSNSSSGGSTAAFCPPLSNQIIAPSIITSRRVDSDSVFISWGPYSGVNTFNIRYGTTNGNWLYNTDVTGFSTTINDLPINEPIWVQIAARNDCTIGTYGEARLVGGPGLPNTGTYSQDNYILSFWLILSKLLHI